MKPLTAIVSGCLNIVLFSSCASHELETLAAGLTLEEACTQVGQIQERRQGLENDARVIVLIKDRHSIAAGMNKVHPALKACQRENRLLIDHLVSLNFNLLGCESALGPLQENARTRRTFALTRTRLQYEADVDRWALFQPVRHLLAHEGKLSVWGVEDPDLLGNDFAKFEELQIARKNAARKDLKIEARRQFAARALALKKELATSIASRGRAAAKNLIDLMNQEKSRHAILLIGGAHMQAAFDELKKSSARLILFECHNYRTR